MHWVLALKAPLGVLIRPERLGALVTSVLAGERGADRVEFLTLPRAILGVAELSEELLGCPCLLRPLTQLTMRDMDGSLAGPDLWETASVMVPPLATM